MKKRLFLCTLILLCVIITSSAQASVSQQVQVHDFYWLSSAEMQEDGNLLLAGWIEGESNRPTLFLCNTDGEILWSFENTVGGFELYRYAAQLPDGTIIALKSVPDNIDGYFTIQFIRGDEIVNETAPIRNPHGLHPVTDGFLVTSTPDSLPGQCQSRVTMFDTDGSVRWEFNWDEYMTFSGIASQDNLHIVYGSTITRDVDTDSGLTNRIMAFDDLGNNLWQHKGTIEEEFFGAAWADDGIVLIGHGYGTGWGNFVALYNDAGQVWRNDFTETQIDGTELKTSAISSILPVDDGYLLSFETSDASRILIRHIDDDGTVMTEWVEAMDGIEALYKSYLFQGNDGQYLVNYGKTEDLTDIWNSDWEAPSKTVKDVPSAIIIKLIEWPN